MRIAQVVQGLPPESLGGTETYVAHLAHALACRGHAVSVFSRVADPTRAEYTVDVVARDGVTITRVNNTFNHPKDFAQSYVNAEIARRFGAFLDTCSPDIVHFHHLMYLSTSCIQEAARRGLPVVMTLHDYWLICQRGRFLKPDLSQCPGQTTAGCAGCFAHLLNKKFAPVYQRLKALLSRRSWVRDRLRHFHGQHIAARPPAPQALRQICQRMAHVREVCQEVSLFLAPSRFLRDQFLAFGIPAEKIIFAECGLPPLEIPTTGRKHTAAPLIFGYIGVVDPVKGVHLLVEAFHPLAGAELRIYGGETDYAPYPDRGRFLSQLRSSPHIRVMGRYDNRDLGKILAEVDVVIVPSIWYENAPLVIREAFLARKPVVTAAFGGMQEWVQHEVNGLLFRHRDVEDLRSTLARFITDSGLVHRLSRNFPAVKSIAEDARELEERYRAFVGQEA
ncbi:MAG TPA: glycosyltransferase family 4 protein [Candidatus Binatia bacterium]|jgi:glycosyltransferase involved in cell wall biosynthesis|nr:glycosyltransferase family 4 protein [Candidatus Binatia bacterium]